MKMYKEVELIRLSTEERGQALPYLLSHGFTREYAVGDSVEKTPQSIFFNGRCVLGKGEKRGFCSRTSFWACMSIYGHLISAGLREDGEEVILDYCI
jgi:hypothetical protein